MMNFSFHNILLSPTTVLEGNGTGSLHQFVDPVPVSASNPPEAHSVEDATIPLLIL